MVYNSLKCTSLLQLALLIAFIVVLLHSIHVWSLSDTIKALNSNYYSLVGVNYDTLVLLSFKPLLSIVTTLSLFLIFSRFVYRCYGERGVKGSMLYLLIMTLTSLLTSIIIANYPSVVHRDVYLHGGVSVYTIINGRYDPIALSRDDAYVSPHTFILYAIYSMITNIDVVPSQIHMTVLYPTLLILLLYILTKEIHLLIPGIGSLPILIIVLPTLITHTIGVTLLHRYYMGLLIVLGALFVVVKVQHIRTCDFITLFTFLISLQFIHPFAASFITLFAILRYFALIISRVASHGRHWALIATISVVALLLYIFYLYPTRMIREAFEWLISVEKTLRFIEVSYPVRVKTPQDEILSYVAYIGRWLWRLTLIIIAGIFLRVFSLNMRNLGSLLSRRWMASLFATIMITFPMIHSFLWQMRFLPFLGITTLLLIKEEFEIINKDKILRGLCITAIALSLAVTPMINYERSYMSEMWNPSSMIYALEFVSSSLNGFSPYGGIKTSIYYTYYSNAYAKPKMISIYDPISIQFRYDVFKQALGKPIVLSLIDPEYVELTRYLSHNVSSAVYNCGTTLVYIIHEIGT